MTTPTRLAMPGMYLDAFLGEVDTEDVVVINRVPENGEVDVPRDATISLDVVSIQGFPLDASTVVVRVIRGATGVTELAYDATAGGVQPGYTGTATLRASISGVALDELLLRLIPNVAFASTEEATLNVTARSTGTATDTIVEYTFIVEDYAAPAILGVLWLTPSRALIAFDEPVAAATIAHYYFRGNCSVVPSPSATQGSIRVRGAAVTSTTAAQGMFVGLRGSLPATNDDDWTISSLTYAPTTHILDLLPTSAALVEDATRDVDAGGAYVRTRSLRCALSMVQLEALTALDGPALGYAPSAPESIQCAYVPLVQDVTLVPLARVPTGVSYGAAVFVDFDEPVSLGRLYRVTVAAEDAHGNTGLTTCDTRVPEFGLELTTSLNFWSNGIVAEPDKSLDMSLGGMLRRLCVVLQDPILAYRYYAGVLPDLLDPAACPSALLPLLLYQRGNPFRFPLEDEELCRRVAEFFPDLMRRRGTAGAIETFIADVLGFSAEIISLHPQSRWILGDATWSVLGHTTIAAPGTLLAKNSYSILVGRDLTAAERIAVREICEWGDPLVMHLIYIIEPSMLSGGTVVLPSGTTWVLGHSILGLSTTLST